MCQAANLTQITVVSIKIIIILLKYSLFINNINIIVVGIMQN